MNRENLSAGFVDLRLSQLQELLPDFFVGSGVLITCLDSNDNPSGLLKWRRELLASGIPTVEVGKFVWIDREFVSALFGQGKTFFGFDEVYLLEKCPPPGNLPSHIFTADRVKFESKPPEVLNEALDRLGAVRYASDGTGIGLNFVCETPELRERIMALRRRS